MKHIFKVGCELLRPTVVLLVCGLLSLEVMGAARVGNASAQASTMLGDCNGDGEVTVDELLLLVNIAFEQKPVSACLAADPDGDGQVDISDILVSVNIALGNFVATPAPTHVGPTATPTAVPNNEPLQVVGVVATGNTSLLVSFSKPVDATGGDVANYSLTLAGRVTGATVTNGDNQVVLSTQPLAAGVPYTVIVSNVHDAQHNPIDPTHNTATFSVRSDINGSGELRVVGAASTWNTTVIVQFNKSMSSSVLQKAHYVIVLGNNDSARLEVTGVAFSADDHSAVTLTTSSQTEARYALAVFNVTDVTGAPLGSKIPYNGGFVDPSTASFPGTPFSCGPKLCTNDARGVGGTGDCASDNDCVDSPPCNSAACHGLCQAPPCMPPDIDRDGLSDGVEAEGWDVTVTLTNGKHVTRHVTSDLHSADTDGDGLDDKTELEIGTDPRRADTDGDGLSDNEEFNVIYSDPTNQDTDGDGNDDKLEVEFFKTNALLADSDGDGFSDSEELYQMNRDPRIADLPQPDFSVGEVRLQIHEQFTYTDENGQTHTEDSNTQTSLATARGYSAAHVTDVLAGFNITGGISPCGGAIGGPCELIGSAPLLLGTVFFQHETQDTNASESASEQAFQSSLDKAQTFSTDSTVTRQIVGARVDVAVTFANKSDVAFTLSKLEITALTTDAQDSTKFVPLATFLPDSQQQSGTAASFNIGPGQSRGPILFSNTQVFPNLVEELMKAPHGLIFKVANYDLTTADGRNFAFGLQAVRERTVNVSVDFGDGTVKQANAITAPVLNRPRNEMRCAPGGDHPDLACASDADCGTSTPCAGGRVIGGLSNFGGTGTPSGIPLDFVLRDIMHLRKTTPPVILAGPDGTSQTHARGDDIQLVSVGHGGLRPDALVVSPGRDGVLQTLPEGDDINSQGAGIVAGPDGIADTVANPKDIQVIPAGTTGLPSDAIVVAAVGTNLLATKPSGDDVVTGPDGILAGPDGTIQSVAQGDDVQLIPAGTSGVPEDTVAIAAGKNGIIDTPHLGDDIADVVTGYEVSKTCDYTTPSAIVAGPNGVADTTVETGICSTAFPPHFAGERGCRNNADCGSDPTRPAGAYGVCGSDEQLVAVGTANLVPFQAVIVPRNAAGRPIINGTYVRSVPLVSSDDQFVGPGIACTTDIDCSVFLPPPSDPLQPPALPIGLILGHCSGPSAVVRVDNRRNGQFRRFWALLSNKTDLVQTDFSQIMVRPGDGINLSFVQDADRDGLIAQEEFLHATSDFNRDTDGDRLDDFEEIRLGWLVGPVGQALRRVFPDPRNADSDGDGLTDLEEKDLRRDQCACDAIGPKTLLGSGNLLRGQPGAELGGRPCTSDADCSNLSTGGICRDTVRCTYADYLLGMPCPKCDTDQTLHRTDPRLRDTDGDRVSDFDEVFGYLTGAGIVSPPLVGGPGSGAVPSVVLAGNGVAHTTACPRNYCVQDDPALPLCPPGVFPTGTNTFRCIGGNNNQQPCQGPGDLTCLAGSPSGTCVQRAGNCRQACQTDGDCEGSHQCIHPLKCDDVQVVAPGTGGLAHNTVVVAPGPLGVFNGILFGGGGDPGDFTIFSDGTHGSVATGFFDNNVAQVKALENAQGDDEQVVSYGQLVFDQASLRCGDGSTFAASGIVGLPQRFPMCGIIKPGPDGAIQTQAQNAPGASLTSTLNNVLVPAGSGQKIEITDPLNPDTDGDEIADGFERLLGSSPNDPTDTGLTNDSDQDGLSDNIEKSGWTVSIGGAHPSSRMVASNPYVQDTDGDGLPDYAELHMPCRDNLTLECPTDPTNADTDGDGLSDYDELSAAQIAQFEALNGFFAGYHFAGSHSKQYGTDPNNPDTDGDGLSDGDEVVKPFYLSVPGESVVRRVFTNASDPDTDHDGLNDKDEEKTYKTDPTDPDTDGDRRLDGREVALHADPVVKDVVAAVTLVDLELRDCRVFESSSWRMTFYVQKPTQFVQYPGTILEQVPVPNASNAPTACPGFEYHAGQCTCGLGSNWDFTPNATLSFPLHEGEGFVVHGEMFDLNNVTCNAAGDAPAHSDSINAEFHFNEPYSYQDLSGFREVTENLGSTGCRAKVIFEITTD